MGAAGRHGPTYDHKFMIGVSRSPAIPSISLIVRSLHPWRIVLAEPSASESTAFSVRYCVSSKSS